MNTSSTPVYINASTTESAEDIAAAGKHYGIDFEVTTSKVGIPDAAEVAETEKTDTVTEVTKPSEGDEPAVVKPEAADTEAKPKADLETAEQAEPGKEETRNKKLLRQVDRLTGKFRSEEVTRKALETQVEELRQQVATLGKKEPAVADVVKAEPENQRPERPKRPKLDQFEYDNDAFETAMEKYEDTVLPAYEDKLSDWTRTNAVREMQEAQAKEAERVALEQEAAVWSDVLDAREGLREKLAEATDVQVSGAMDAVLRTMMTSEERANLLEYLVDNPEVAADLTEQTTSKKSRPTRTDWEYNTALASRLLTKLEGQISKPEPAVTKPKAEVVPITPPAKPKPVSAAPPPIEPVGARAGSAATRLDDPNIPTDEYMARRQQERMDKFRKQRA